MPLERLQSFHSIHTKAPSQLMRAMDLLPSSSVDVGEIGDDFGGVRGRENYLLTAEFSKKLQNLTEIAEEKRVQFPTKQAALSQIKHYSSQIKKSHLKSIEALKKQIKTLEKEISNITDPEKLKIATDRLNNYKINLASREGFLKQATNFKKLSDELDSALTELSKMSVKEVKDMLRSKDGTLFDTIDEKFSLIDEILLEICNIEGGQGRATDIECLQEDYAVFRAQLNHAITLCLDPKANPASGPIDENASFSSFLHAENGKISGSATLLRTIQDEINPILDRLEKATKIGSNKESLKINVIIAEAKNAISSLEKIRDYGVALDPNKPKDRILAPRSEMNALITTLRDSVANLTEKKEKYLDTLISKSVKALSVYDKMMGLDFSVINWCNKKGLDFLASVLRDFNNEYQSKFPNGVSSSEDLIIEENILLANIQKHYSTGRSSLSDFLNDLQKLLSFLEKHPDYKSIARDIMEYFTQKNMGIAHEQFSRIKIMEGLRNNVKLPTSDYKALLQGTDVVTLAYARASGLRNCHIQTDLSQTILDTKKTKKLGNGSLNTVKLVHYDRKDSDGVITTHEGVFKPEFNARIGLIIGVVPCFLNYHSKQRVLGNNCAASFAAEQLGNPGIVAKSKFTIVDGEPGILMEKAKGREAHEIKPKDFVTLTKQEGIRMRGQLMRSLNQLQWTDVLCAQMDRHDANFLVDVDLENKSISVMGIDNDACFGINMVGMRSIRITMSQYKDFFKYSFAGRIKGTTMDADRKHVTCNLEAMNSRERIKLVNRFGAFCTAMPSYIDSDTYNSLKQIKPDDYKRQMLERLQDEDAASAAVARLEEAQKYAEKLYQKGRVLSKEQWEDDATQKEVYEEQINKAASQIGVDPQNATLEQDGFARVSEPFLRKFAFLMNDRIFKGK